MDSDGKHKCHNCGADADKPVEEVPAANDLEMRLEKPVEAVKKPEEKKTGQLTDWF